MKHAYVISKSVNDGSSCAIDYEISGATDYVEDSWAYLARQRGGRLADEALKVLETPGNTIVIKTKPKIGRLPEVIGDSIGPYFLSPAARALVEELEPGLHRFDPFETTSVMELEGRTDHGGYYRYFRMPTAVECVAVEESEMDGRYLPDNAERRIAIYRQDVAGKHLWYVHVNDRQRRLMCSDTFARLYKERKMRGWEMRHRCDLVDRVVH